MNNDRRKRIRAELTNLEKAMGLLSDIKSALEDIRDEEQEAYDNMPESFQNGDKGEAAQAAIGELDSAIDALDGALDGDPVGSLESACE